MKNEQRLSFYQRAEKMIARGEAADVSEAGRILSLRRKFAKKALGVDKARRAAAASRTLEPGPQLTLNLPPTDANQSPCKKSP